ncbi:MAG TPA: FAD-dependent oxidoreductase [Burkholderiaceae bacterium]|nr:FAD-dependent oxidoreductase [Burkholderiaceae bacterium]
MGNQRILVIGAGIIGVACAHALQRKGYSVSLADEREPGDGCSFGNAGNISPGAVVPYSVPGSLRQIPGWLTDPLGPLAIRPRHFLRFLPWGLQWLRSSSVQRALEVSRAMRVLHAGSLERYADMLEPTGNGNIVQTSGQLYVSRIPGKAIGRELERFMREAAGIRTEVLDGHALRDLEPALSRDYCSGLLLPDNGKCLNPQRLVRTLAQQVVSRGATLIPKRVRGFDKSEGRVRGVVFEDGETQAFDQIVIAAGAWSNELTSQLGTFVPLEAERGYHVTLTDPGIVPRLPITNKDFSFASAPMEMGVRLAGTAEYAGLQAEPDWRRAHVLLRHAEAMFPGMRTTHYTQWMGMRPALPDGLPILDRSPNFPSVLLAFGNAHFGLTAAPMMGSLIAELAASEPSPVDLKPFAVTRFGKHAAVTAEQGQ